MTAPLWFAGAWTLVGAFSGWAFHPVGHRLGHVDRTSGRAVFPAIATAILFGLLAWRTGIHVELLAFSYLAMAGVPLTMIDITELRLPTRLVWSTCLATLGLLITAAAVDDHGGRALVRAIAGMVALPTAYLILALSTRGGLGAGDVRLAAVIGLVLAWRSWPALAAGTIVALIFGCITGLIAITLRRASRASPIPYGPHMIAGALIGLLLNAPPTASTPLDLVSIGNPHVGVPHAATASGRMEVRTGHAERLGLSAVGRV